VHLAARALQELLQEVFLALFFLGGRGLINEGNTCVINLVMFLSGKIKELLSVELDIPASQMELHGWIHKNDAMIQDTVS